MGNGSYDTNSRQTRAQSSGYFTQSAEKIFESRSVFKGMSPVGLKFRECCDNADHPFTVPIAFNLDVTGSMGVIPADLVKHGLPTIMDTFHKKGLKDATLCFLGIGDHNSDRGPLQIGQFEADDEKLDHWLTKVWIEKGGGANGGESYFLAWYAAARHMKTDAWDKRNQKGFLFTAGDEPCHKGISAEELCDITELAYEKGFTAKEILAEAQQRWHVYHLNLNRATDDGWNDLLGENNIKVNDYRDIPNLLPEIVLRHYKANAEPAHVPTVEAEGSDNPPEFKPSILL